MKSIGTSCQTGLNAVLRQQAAYLLQPKPNRIETLRYSIRTWLKMPWRAILEGPGAVALVHQKGKVYFADLSEILKKSRDGFIHR